MRYTKFTLGLLAGGPDGARIQLLGYDNGIGLSRDLQLLAKALSVAGHVVTVMAVKRDSIGRKGLNLGLVARRWLHRLGRRAAKFDITLMVERVRPAFAWQSPINVLLVNPDHFKASDHANYDVLDAVFIKTLHARALVEPLGKPVISIGFTSADRWRPDIRRGEGCFHLAGHSGMKGTASLIAAWRRHPEWPLLTVVQHPDKAVNDYSAANIRHITRYLADAELLELQNAHRYHLCPSETEGFGHHLVEAMSCAALVLTTDAAPMNELVGPERGILVHADRTANKGLGTRYLVNVDALEQAIATMFALDPQEVAARGAAARRWWEDNNRRFCETLARTVTDVMDPTTPLTACSRAPATTA